MNLRITKLLSQQGLYFSRNNIVNCSYGDVLHAVGGPVFNQAGECVGIAFQSLASGDAENIGYVIPTPVIDHFLTDYQRNGAFTGFPAISVRWQSTESQPLRWLTILSSPCRSLHVNEQRFTIQFHTFSSSTHHWARIFVIELACQVSRHESR